MTVLSKTKTDPKLLNRIYTHKKSIDKLVNRLRQLLDE